MKQTSRGILCLKNLSLHIIIFYPFVYNNPNKEKGFIKSAKDEGIREHQSRLILATERGFIQNSILS